MRMDLCRHSWKFRLTQQYLKNEKIWSYVKEYDTRAGTIKNTDAIWLKKGSLKIKLKKKIVLIFIIFS